MMNIKNRILSRRLLNLKSTSRQFADNLRTIGSTTESNKLTKNNNDYEEKDGNYNYFGIDVAEDDSILHGQYARKNKDEYLQQINEKYRPLIRSKQKFVTSNKINNLMKAAGSFKVRLDIENLPKYHGEFENKNNNRNEVVFKTMNDVLNHMNQNSIDEPIELKCNNKTSSRKSKVKFETINNDENDRIENDSGKSTNNNQIVFRYSELLSSELNIQSTNDKNNTTSEDWITFEQNKRDPPGKKSNKTGEENLSERIMAVKLEQIKDESQPKSISGYEYLKQIRLGKRQPKLREEFEDVLKNYIRKEKLDTKGYRVLTNQVPNFSQLTNDEILKMLQAQILFNDQDIVALNKPYGIAIHGAFGDCSIDDRIDSKLVVSNRINLNHFLPKLANHLECEKLFTVHRLDRDTTGVLLLAKTQEKAKQLNELFKEQKIVKKYLCITKNKPDQDEGIIDIPIDLGYIETNSSKRKRERMVLCPESVEEIRMKRNWRTARKAITYYKVKSNNGNATLIEATPETGIRHQIRVHLGFGLRCPILGDHKYSNLDSLSPQRLPSDILMALHIRQSKARTVPMHLHALSIMIPEMGKNGRNIFIKAPLPYHFRQNMKSLKLQL